MGKQGRGTGNRYANDLGGNHIARLREYVEKQTTGPSFRIAYQKRFCETCKLLKPRNAAPAVKGWKCDDCKGK